MRTKKIETTLHSHEDADQVLLEIGRLDARKLAVESWATERVARVHEEAKSRLLLDGAAGETVDTRRAALAANLLAYVELHAAEFTGDGGRRSVKLAHGELGYRLGTPKVDTVGRITQKALLTMAPVLAKLRQYGWIKEEPTLSKQQILNEWAALREQTAARLPEVNLTVVQDDEPWFEPARVELPAVE